MKDHTYRPRRLPSILNPACAERETTGRRFCYGFECGCIDASSLVRQGNGRRNAPR